MRMIQIEAAQDETRMNIAASFAHVHLVAEHAFKVFIPSMQLAFPVMVVQVLGSELLEVMMSNLSAMHADEVSSNLN